MENESSSKLYPITKLRIWQAVRRNIFDSMDRNLISPEKADLILNFVQKSVLDVETPEEAAKYCELMTQKFPELIAVKYTLDLEQEENLDKCISKVLEYLMNKGDFEKSNKLMMNVTALQSDKASLNVLIDQLLRDYSILFK